MKNTTLHFNTHADMVAAVEQLTDDLTDITTNTMELTIRVDKDKITEETNEWLEKVCYKILSCTK